MEKPDKTRKPFPWKDTPEARKIAEDLVHDCTPDVLARAFKRLLVHYVHTTLLSATDGELVRSGRWDKMIDRMRKPDRVSADTRFGTAMVMSEVGIGTHVFADRLAGTFASMLNADRNAATLLHCASMLIAVDDVANGRVV